MEVLAVENGKALLISKYGLDCMPYNTERKEVTWETCSLRKWLNNEFFNEAFATNQQNLISLTNVSDVKYPYSADPGNATSDKIFLLSKNEAEKYSIARDCAFTAYADPQHAYISCSWWLRSPGNEQYSASYALHYDTTQRSWIHSVNVDYKSCAVRPAMWINLP